MSMIAREIAAERALADAPRVAVGPGYSEALDLALAHARARLSLPAVVPIVWVSHRGNRGETWWWPDGRVEVRINVADMSPRLAAWAILHELKHVADGQQFCTRYPEAAEDAANTFAFDVTERQTQDFYRLDNGRPSGRR